MIGSLGRGVAHCVRVARLDGVLTALGHRLSRGRYQILTYHRVNDEKHPLFPAVPTARFVAEMEMVAKRFRVLPLTELIDRAEAGTLPPGALAVTFDDGYRDNYTNAFPVLRRLGLPATIFLATGALDRRVPLWHDRVFDAFRDTRAKHFDWNRQRVSLVGGDRRRITATVLADLKRRLPGERDTLLAALLEDLEVEDPGLRTGHILNWGEVRRMARHGVDFGAHTVTHTILTNLDAELAAAEIQESTSRIQDELQRRVEVFAYPNGGAGDFDETIKVALRSCGLRAAVTTIWGANDANSDPLALRRVSLIDRDPSVSGLRLAFERGWG